VPVWGVSTSASAPSGHVPLNENTPQQIHGVSWGFHGPKENDVKLNDFIELRWE